MTPIIFLVFVWLEKINIIIRLPVWFILPPSSKCKTNQSSRTKWAVGFWWYLLHRTDVHRGVNLYPSFKNFNYIQRKWDAFRNCINMIHYHSCHRNRSIQNSNDTKCGWTLVSRFIGFPVSSLSAVWSSCEANHKCGIFNVQGCVRLNECHNLTRFFIEISLFDFGFHHGYGMPILMAVYQKCCRGHGCYY